VLFLTDWALFGSVHDITIRTALHFGVLEDTMGFVGLALIGIMTV
jgi:hypothetical protein